MDKAVATTEVLEATEDRGGGGVVEKEVRVGRLSIHKERPQLKENSHN